MTKTKEFFIADTHFGDKNIIKMDPKRTHFNNVEEMDSTMIKYWNETVGVNDKIFVLGDFISTNNREYIIRTVNQLNGQIILIRGNHDTDEICEILRRETKVKVIDFPIVMDGFWILSHEPMFVTETAPYANIFGHVHSNPMYKTVSTRSYCVSAERINFTPIEVRVAKEAVYNAG